MQCTLGRFSLLAGVVAVMAGSERRIVERGGRLRPVDGSATEPAQRTSELLGAMSLSDKIQMVTGQGEFNPTTANPEAAGNIAANPALCIPALVLNDATAGVGDQQPLTTAFPDSIALASAWDPSLAQQYGAALGREAFAKGVNVMLGPGVDIARNPLNGRNFEYAGEDPYLAGQAAAAIIRGIQSQHVIATVKHYALNDQETNRNIDSSDASERTMQEIDLPAFDAAVKLGPGQSATITIPLDAMSFAHWDTVSHKWAVSPGAYQVLVGSSSRDIAGQGAVTLPAEAP